MNKTILLSKPIKAHGDAVTQLELAEPTGKTIRACGSPFKIEMGRAGSQIMIIDTESVALYISELGNIPGSSVNLLSAADFGALQAVVIGFFGEAPPLNTGTGTGN
jgi:Phage tail assembly chaperone proteins, E, or 41 or 14